MKYIYILLTAMSLMFLGSCNLEKNPYDSVTPGDLEGDLESNIAYQLTGTYGRLKPWSEEIHRIGEYAGDNVNIRNTTTDAFFDYITYKHAEDNGRIYNFWNYSYKAIVQSNDILSLLSKETDPKWETPRGEAYFIRGLSYFYLTTVFGRPYYDSPETNLGVPINLAPSPTNMSEINAPDRSTVKECYAQAIRDLRMAEKLLKNEKSAAYATKAAAQALLSKVYLYMSGTYDAPNAMYADSVIHYANEVINTPKYKLLSRDTFMKYNTLAPDDVAQTETVFAIKRVSSEFSGSYGGSLGSMYATIQGQGWGEMYATSKYMDILKEAGYQKQDARWAFIEEQYIFDKDKKKVPAFRFIAQTYEKDGVTLKGYTYVQNPLLQKADGSYYIERSVQGTNPGDAPTIVEHPLTAISAADNRYSVVWSDGITYEGEIDYQMALNMTHPMYYILKCSLQGFESHLHSPVVSRLGELYLNIAEAYVKKGKYSDAMQNLNVIRERSIVGGGYTSADFTSANAGKLVEKERQLELAFEGQRAFDIYRNGGTLTRRYPGAHNPLQEVKASDARVVHFIPQKEIDAYPIPLTQNPK